MGKHRQPRKPRYSRNHITIKDSYAELILSNGQIALIDLIDVDLIKQHRWRFNNGYARSVIGDRTNHVYLHHFLIKDRNGLEIDHKNGNGLDNRRSNLRLATSGQNKINRKSIGVSVVNGKFRAFICVNKKNINLGTFTSFEKALQVREGAANRLHGEYAYIKR